MENYEGTEKNTSSRAVTSLAISLVQIGGVVLAYLMRFFGEYLAQVKIPESENPIDNPYLDPFISFFLRHINIVIGATVPLIQDFFKFFFSPVLGWSYVILSVLAFILGVIGLSSPKKRTAVLGMVLTLLVLVYYWWLLSQHYRGISV